MPKSNTTRDDESSGPYWRASSECPHCDAPLQLRENRKDKSRFFGCSAYPHCRFSEPICDTISSLAELIDSLEVSLSRARSLLPADGLSKELRRLIFAFHPDRNADPIPAHRIVCELTALRSRIAA